MFTQDFETLALRQATSTSPATTSAAKSPAPSQPQTPAPSRPASRASQIPKTRRSRLSAIVDRLLRTDAPPVKNVAVPKQPSDGFAHFAPGGSSMGGLL
ncbi:hypothetical protein C8F01DRAFT_1255586 [Mycena amicta]|nr:hypothetical protein C8F01DRAFT_1255586 [Mycena amicta]